MDRVPKTQEVMDWRIAASLFLIATGVGSYLVGFLLSLIDPAEFRVLSRLAVVLAAPFVLIGGLLLLCDMGQKRGSYRMFSRPGSSWMSRGAFFMTIFLIFNLIHIFTGIWPKTSLLSSPTVYLIVGIIASILAILSLVYTGFLLGVVKAIPFWSGSFLPWLFLSSGLSTGAMAASLFFSIYKFAGGEGPEESLAGLARFNFFVIILEAIVLFSYLGAMKSRAAGSVKTVTCGKLAGAFWGGVVVAALILPFVIEALQAFIPFSLSSLLVLALLGGIIGLIGGYMLRYVVVYGGTRIPLNIQGQLVDPPPEKYETKVIESAYQSFQKA
jgi:polysulfide reductase chain C